MIELPETAVPSTKTDPSLVKGKERFNGRHVPNHIAIIMDGNGRWARRRGLPRTEGHRAGTQNIRRILESLQEYGVRYVTLFAFSTENWSRPSDEIQALMGIIRRTVEEETQTLLDNKVQLRYLGRMDRLTPELRASICGALKLTQNNSQLTLNVALDYGGRDEILQAVKRIVEDGIRPERIDAGLLKQYLYTHDLPDPDLIIRTAGEQRLSNFLVWQSVYSEYFHSPVFWPDFDKKELDRALNAFSRRKRRFGALEPEE